MPTYYISPTGNDNADGQSAAMAWKTLSRLDTAFESRMIRGGDSILLERGGAWKASATNRIRVRNVPTTAAARLIFGAYGNGVYPLITGTGYSAYLFGTGIDDAPVHFVSISSLDIRYTSEAQVCYLHDCHDWDIRANYFDGLVLIEGAAATALTFIGNDFAQTKAIVPCSTIYIGHWTDMPASGPHDILFAGNSIHDILGIWDDYPDAETEGIDVKNGTRGLVIRGNAFRNIQGGNFITLRGSNHQVYDNVMDGAKGAGVCGWLNSGESGWDVSGNTISNCKWGVRLEGPGNKIHDNHFINCATPMVYAVGTDVGGNIIGDEPVPPAPPAPPTPPTPPTPAPTATISASVKRYWWWWKVTLTWKCENAKSASLGGIGSVALSGTKTVTVSKRGTYVYIITATAVDDRTAPASVTVTIK
jgi:hypothetical protein